MKRKYLPLNVFFISLAYLLITSFAISDDRSDQKLSDTQRAQKYKLQAMTQGGINSVDGPGDAPRAAAKFLPIDMDDDGMADTWETTNGLDPSDPNDAWLDPDNDQVVNLFEFQLGSGMNNAATPEVITVGDTGAQYTDVKTAIDTVTDAVPGKVIRVAGGTYSLNYKTFSSTKVVMIQGGWSPDFSARDLKLYPTTFDGGNEAEIIYFSISSGRPVMVLNGINFINGKESFGAVNLLAQGSAFMRTSVFNCSITQSESTTTSGAVLSMFNWNTSESDRTIANTVIGGNNGNGIYAQFHEGTTARWRIINTTISNNKNIGSNGYGIDVLALDNGVLNAHVYNSTIWGNDQEAIKIWGKNNTFNVDHSNINNVSATQSAIYRPGMGMLNTDPLYIDPTAGNYHLQPSSPMIDVGINTGVPEIDFEGDPRLVGTAVDIGADEAVSSMTP